MTPFEPVPPGSPTPPTPRDLLTDPRDRASEGWTISPVPFDPFVPPTDGPAPSEALLPDFEEEDDETPAEAYAHARPGVLRRGVLRRIAASPVIRVPAAVLGGSVFIATLYVLTTRPQLAQPAPESSVQTDAETMPVVPFAPDEPYTFRGLDIHPDRMFGAYFGGAFVESANADSSAGDRDFAYRLAMYRRSYGVDDNFTISIFDERTGERLETSTLSALQSEYEATGRMNWDAVDAARRGETSRLRAKWEAAGIPRDAVTVRWGRANQTHEARTRDLPYLSYEIQLARRLGLSLLSTEIGTVETFNQDWLVSSAGARSRYQMMPDIMEMFGVENYRVPVVSGGTVQVREELHPLLSMEPSMMLLRGYANAVGHELPGISAYHTGPGNLFILYQTYIRAHAANPPTNGHVSDAYMWGITDGFMAVDEQSSFGPESRAYVMKAYGSLRATENEMVDPADTFRGERVRMRREAATTLSRLLQTLAAAPRLDWGPGNDRGGLYTR
ncbi:MAG TPA: hypothetical protein VK610_02890, partial [Rhodothermales bacterium]|nr:hypothetical protein [Rhodothermales bacterium]